MKNIVKKNWNKYKWHILVLVAGIFLGWLLFSSDNKQSEGIEVQVGHEGHDHAGEAKTIWTCSMHPQIRQDKPGKCPICAMDLVPVSSLKSDGRQMHPDEVQLSESAAKLADIQTFIVRRGFPEKDIYLQGKVQADERRVAELTARFGGRIEKLFISFTGENVAKGQKLATIYSPELVSAQKELLEAVSYKDVKPSLYKAARGKLKLWDLTEEQINAIEESEEPQMYFEILSPISGTVTKRHVSLGDYVKVGEALFEVTDLTHVWLMFDAYESDLPWINKGDEVSYSVHSLPGRKFLGKVNYIDPFLDPSTRVAKVRVEANNNGLLLKPEMFARGIVESRYARGARKILVPKTSILWTGKRAVVYVKIPDSDQPSFKFREIDLGPVSGNYYVVEKGLQEGEEIVTNGVFKIDAAAQLEGKPSMMNPEGGKVSTGHDHGSMTMGEAVENAGHTKKETEAEKVVVDIQLKEQLQKVFDSYIEMKDAFVSSDPEAVSQQATIVASNLKNVDMELLSGDAHMKWMGQLEKLQTAINDIIKNTELEKQRERFAEFSKVLYSSLKTFGLKDGMVYYQYCPMAFQNKGAFWLSTIKEIRNPYFGDEMLKCGETREELEFK